MKLSSRVSLEALKKKYQKAHRANHPDRRGSYQKLVKINETYRLAHDRLCTDLCSESSTCYWASYTPASAESFTSWVAVLLAEIYSDEWDIDNAYRKVLSLRDNELFDLSDDYVKKYLFGGLIGGLMMQLFKAGRDHEAAELVSFARQFENVISSRVEELEKLLADKSKKALRINHPRQAENAYRSGLIQEAKRDSWIEKFSLVEREGTIKEPQLPTPIDTSKFSPFEPESLPPFTPDGAEEAIEEILTAPMTDEQIYEAFDRAVDLLNGKGVTRDHAEAARLFRKVAKFAWYPALEAQFCLALIYSSGEGVPQDYAEVLKWYTRSAKGGYAEAQYNMGIIYRTGEGAPQDYAEALKWFRKAARKNNDHAAAQYFLGEMYYYGEGVPQGYKEALKWYRKAAAKGNESGQYFLGRMYDNGEGVRQDYTEAVKWYHLAAEQGHPDAQRCLGIKYHNGEGVQHAGSVWCAAEAEKWLGKAADQGDAQARDILNSIKGGEMYEYFSQLLEPKETQDYLINAVSQFVLNYCNNIYDICYGIALGELEDDVAPFHIGVLAGSYEQLWEKYEYFMEEEGVYDSDVKNALQNALTDFLSSHWPSIIKKRLDIESQFQHAEEFVTLRNFMILLKSAGIDFYTKASDGCGPDIIGGTVTTDLIHSNYEDTKTINENYSSAAIHNAMEGYKGHDSYGFATLNYIFTGESKAGIEFFGPGYAHPFYRFIKKENERKEHFLKALTDLSESLSLPVSLGLKFKPGEDRIVFNVAWERRLPEVFYEISNHTRENRFS